MFSSLGELTNANCNCNAIGCIFYKVYVLYLQLIFLAFYRAVEKECPLKCSANTREISVDGFISSSLKRKDFSSLGLSHVLMERREESAL